MPIAEFITKYYPAVIIKFTKNAGECEMKEFDEYLQKFKELYNREHEFNILLDSSKTESFPISYVLKHAFFLIQHKELTEQFIKKSAVVITNPTFKKLLNIVFSIYTPKSDLIVTANLGDALVHVLDKSVINREKTRERSTV